jgi:DNA mismatch endonuclease, patch repair protein
MERQGRRDTKPELAVRRAVWALGLRYRVDVAPVKGGRRRADMVFPTERVAVYVDGCYWHRCPQHGTLPKANAAWWLAKLEANVARDRDTDERLAEAGWTVIRIWEHELPLDAAARIHAVVTSIRSSERRP